MRLALAFRGFENAVHGNVTLKKPSVLEGYISKWKGFTKTEKNEGKRVFVRMRSFFSSGPLLLQYLGLV